jgi:D123
MANETNYEFAEPTDGPKKWTELPFPPLKKSQVMNCSYHSWHPRYRAITPKARLVPLTTPFLAYLRADGIFLPDDNPPQDSDGDSGIFSGAEADGQAEEEEDVDVAAEWREVHEAVKSTIAELGGKVVPKLNWSAPKDATWINPSNSMECQTAGDIYLLLKSSDFVTHDIEHAFDDCVDGDDEASNMTKETIPYHLVLRKYVQLNPSVEFRCFVRRRKLIAICQRDLNHFDFLFKMENALKSTIQKFFHDKLESTFPDESFVFDVYIPPPHERVWLIDVNPWAIRTDPLIFSWLELLTMDDEVETTEKDDKSALDDSDSDAEEVEEVSKYPIFRLVGRDDPEAYGFTTPQYSAHKLPKDVVDASQGGEGQLREFADKWKELIERQREQDADSDTE